MTQPIPERLAALRDAMRERDIAACVLPTADPHLSEYLPARWQARQWYSGFSGSAGTLVVTSDRAGLWTDSRYFEQAERELDGSGIALMRLVVPHAPEHVDWLCAQIRAGQRVAVAGDSIAAGAAATLREALAAHGASLVAEDPAGDAWTGRPPLPSAPAVEHPAAFAVRARADKLASVRAAMQAAGASHHLVSSLDDIAWLTNLRGTDVPYNPVFVAHLLLTADKATLFVPAGKIGPVLEAVLAADGVRLAPYAGIATALAALPRGARLLFDPERVAWATADAVPAHVERIAAANPSTLAKACKSAAELGHVRETMRQDGAALVRCARWLDEALARGERVSELDVDARLRTLRAERAHFVGESFATIAGYMANGALPHYRATPERHATVARDGLLLIDSGGQYLGGTTDITRVWAFGATTVEQRRDVTLVLKGVIALSRARFPAGTSGQQLDALARAPIWSAGIDYGHGTGHGVGYFLNVHEGPQSIRPPRAGARFEPLRPGMITSIEPGIYKPGRHGVRIENLAATVPAGDGEFGEFLAFETLTLCPIDSRALEPALLEPSERAWLDAYHAGVLEKLAPLLDDAGDRAWLQRRCAPLQPA
ncbi:MAG: aminopeptidase P family protein [Xanthomonadaceae bacterium]|nr:aminopeptidase P family protein [Xanthomonadaceae bacterium]